MLAGREDLSIDGFKLDNMNTLQKIYFALYTKKDFKIDFKQEYQSLTVDENLFLLRLIGYNYMKTSIGRNVLNSLLHRLNDFCYSEHNKIINN